MADIDLSTLRIDKSDRARRDASARWPWLVLLVLLLGVAVAWGVWPAAAVEVRVVRVRVSANAVANDPVVLNATGYVMAAHKIELASKAVGRVAWVGVEMGDKIKKGDVLVRLEDDEYRARVAQEQGQLDSAKAKLAELKAGQRPQEIATVQATLAKSLAELAVAKTNLKRLSDLESTRAVSRQQIDDASALVNAREAQVEADRQQLELAKAGTRQESIDAQAGTVRQLEGGLTLANVDLSNTVIRSPVNATVLARNVEIGEFVTTGFVGDNGAKGYVLSIADLNDLRVDLDVSQKDFANVRASQPCSVVTDAYPDRKYKGVVDLISPEANRQKATVQVRVKVLNPDDLLKPDMNATVSFLAPQATTAAAAATQSRPVFVVPASAVRDGVVFVVENGRAVRRAVKVEAGRANESNVTDGLIGGEDVVLDPPTALTDNAPVRPRADGPETNP